MAWVYLDGLNRPLWLLFIKRLNVKMQRAFVASYVIVSLFATPNATAAAGRNRFNGLFVITRIYGFIAKLGLVC